MNASIVRRTVLPLLPLTLIAAACPGLQRQASPTPSPPETIPSTGVQTPSPGAQAPVELEVQTVASRLDTIWALAFTPDGRLFFTERGGRVRVRENGAIRDEPVLTLPVRETSEGGLMGLAVDPGWPGEPYLYTMYTYEGAQGLANKVARLRWEGDTAREDQVLLDDIPAAGIHNGGRVKFGPDGRLYVTTGDAGNTALSQDRSSLAGKILRLNRDGSIPQDNPFAGSPVYSYGHRNAQGLAWRPSTAAGGPQQLYATEHGPVGNDEVNLIEAGLNYGWPVAQGPDHPEPFRSPLIVYTPSVAPAGAAFSTGMAIPQWQGSFFFATLRGTHLHRLVFDPRGGVLEQEELYRGVYGRLRDVVEGPDGALYVATSNRDGRGRPQAEDDRILRIAPR
jgi:aldose sugar dehydrogenase